MKDVTNMATESEVLEEIERLLGRLDLVDTECREIETRKDAEVTRLIDRYARHLDPLTEEREALMRRLSELFVENETLLTRGGQKKTAVFRSGTLSSRTTSGSLIIEDEAAAIAWLRKKHKLRAFTRIKTTIDKLELKKHPEVYANMPGVRLDQSENLLVKLARTRIELKRDLHPFRRRIR